MGKVDLHPHCNVDAVPTIVIGLIYFNFYIIRLRHGYIPVLVMLSLYEG